MLSWLNAGMKYRQEDHPSLKFMADCGNGGQAVALALTAGELQKACKVGPVSSSLLFKDDQPLVFCPINLVCLLSGKVGPAAVVGATNLARDQATRLGQLSCPTMLTWVASLPV